PMPASAGLQDILASAPPTIDKRLPAAGRVLTGGCSPSRRIIDDSEEPDDLMTILSLQSADGWFGSNDHLQSRVLPQWKQQKEAIIEALPKLTSTELANEHQLILTALILVILRHRFADREALWKRASEKAVRWITHSASVDIPTVQKWLDALKMP